MGKIDYSSLENQMMKRIAVIRAEYASDNNGISEEVFDAMNSSLFNYRPKNERNYEFVIKSVDKYLYEIIEEVIIKLFSHNQIPVSTKFVMNINGNFNKVDIKELFIDYKKAPLFAIIKKDNDIPVLYMFKNYGVHNTLSNYRLSQILTSLGVKEYRYVSFVEKYAYSEIINYNDDYSDITRGTNIYSIKDFFIDNFGEEEYKEFKEFADRLNAMIKSCLGYSILKTLTPNALFSFKKEVEKEIINYPYHKEIVNKTGITDNQYRLLKSQYVDKKYYKAVINEGDFNSRFGVDGCQFAESFITAEWLYQSIQEVGKMDLTAIAMGYFKSIEQLLYVFIFSHIGEKKWIDTYDRPNDWQNIPINKRKWQSPVNEKTVYLKKKYIMFERMINFIKEYEDLFIDISIRDYLVERLKDAQQLRNGYFHKDNLSEEDKVKKARDDAFIIYFILLGSMRSSEQINDIMGIPGNEVQFDMLCEYIDCNSKLSYYFEMNGIDTVALGLNDENVAYSKDGKPKYSGIYMNKLNIPVETEIIRVKESKSISRERLYFDKDNVPKRIYIGKFEMCKEGIRIAGTKKLIWDNGLFFGDK